MLKKELIIHPDFDHLRPFLTALPETFSSQGEVIYDGRNEIRVMEQDGIRINVKRYKVPLWINRVAYTFLRRPKAVRAYEYALKLRQMGVNTPQPIAYMLLWKNGLLEFSYFISIQVEYSRNFYEFGTPPLSPREPVVEEFARYTADLHQRGVYHKDYSPGNILFDVIDGKPEFCIVDINRMQFGPISPRKGCYNFARLWGKEDFFRIIAEYYADARKLDREQCLEWVLKAWRRFWRNRVVH